MGPTLSVKRQRHRHRQAFVTQRECLRHLISESALSSLLLSGKRVRRAASRHLHVGGGPLGSGLWPLGVCFDEGHRLAATYISKEEEAGGIFNAVSIRSEALPRSRIQAADGAPSYATAARLLRDCAAAFDPRPTGLATCCCSNLLWGTTTIEHPFLHPPLNPAFCGSPTNRGVQHRSGKKVSSLRRC